MTAAPPKTKAEAFDLSSIVPGVIAKPPRALTDKFSAGIFGPKGSGKTSLLGSAAEVEELGPVAILAVEDGASVLSGVYDDVQVVHVEDYDTARNVIGAWVNGHTPWKTFCIDTFYKLQQLMKRDCTETGYGLWGYVADESEKIITRCHETKAGNFIFTTHAERLQDDSGKIINVPTFVGKKSLIEVLKPIDELYFLTAKADGTRILQTRPNGKNEASTRAPRMPMEIEDPTYAEIYSFYKTK